LFAHIDAKEGTPGALDNATGAAVLLLVAEELTEYAGRLGVEIVALNGEDHYSAAGEMQYLRLNAGRFGEIALGINLDGAGYREGDTCFSLYGCPDELAATVRHTMAHREGLSEGPPWYQGDHGLFLAQQVPALAITSERFEVLWAEVAHTPRDAPELVDPTKLLVTAHALAELIMRLDRALPSAT
jgi:aminopeptidase YwaD